MFDRPDLPVPFWRSYLRNLLGVKILHVYVSMPTKEDDPVSTHTYDWYATLGMKDCMCVVYSKRSKG